ncbi:3-isopropylmalate dehydratase small subunit [Legionella fallonii]|uniref:3-isopropylmalate dehydratase small subunit n=1 Tax=Legionella fallonii LLAP-10 TaxID=1212491 RepID=A0A098G596_9GAMM|nr:3-isopropylmalate dehydratase small subunit [Legionella fallonii]CEG57154.1 3-isopropylmalate dehydratase small subunit [Legionella fallonii LLAP-10]
MKAFKTVTGVMAYLPIANIDTDMIIPKQYLKTITRTGLGNYLFAEMRYDEVNNPKADFILNQNDYQNTRILVAEENFGCGSSREHAVWSLVDFGINVVIAPSFADIFYNNSFKNGLLPIVLTMEEISLLKVHTAKLVTVNLESQFISMDSLVFSFSIDAYRKESLLHGWDEIAQTLLYEDKISTFEATQKIYQPWLFE